MEGLDAEGGVKTPTFGGLGAVFHDIRKIRPYSVQIYPTTSASSDPKESTLDFKVNSLVFKLLLLLMILAIPVIRTKSYHNLK